MSRSEFQGVRVLVTGAGGVHGRWIAEAFAKDGARLVLTDVREEPLEQLADELRGAGADAVARVADLRSEASIDELAAFTAARWGSPDVLVNNAGIYPRQKLLETDGDGWARVMDINVTAVHLLTRGVARLMIAAGVRGSIVNITSGAAGSVRPGSVPYSTSKAALTMLTRGYALELAPHGIRVNAVSPGFAPGSEVSLLDDSYVEAMVRSIPLGRTSGPHDSSEAVLFLCSTKASFITGATIAVDGGRSAGTFSAPSSTG